MKINMYLLLTAFLFAFFYSTPLFAQKKTLPGYYITQQSDTVRGVFSSYAQWSKNPSQVEFTAKQATESIQLTPQNSRKFVIEGYDEYLAYSGQRLVNSIENDALLNQKFSNSATDSTEQVFTFLRLVTRTTGGDLYVLNDTKRTNFFYQLPAQALEELKYKITLDQNRLNEIAEYKQQLNRAFAAVIVQKGLFNSLEKLRYTEEDLSSFFHDMFPVEKANHKPRSVASGWIVSAGMVLNKVAVDADTDFDEVPRNYNSHFSPAFSIGCLLPVDRSFGKYFIYPQVRVFRYKNKGEEKQDNYINSTTYQADLAFIATMGGGVNFVNQENIQCFVRGGLGVLAQVDGKQIKIQESANPSAEVDVRETALRGLVLSVEASAGVSLNRKLFLTATYTPPMNIGSFVIYAPKLSGIQFSVGYKIP